MHDLLAAATRRYMPDILTEKPEIDLWASIFAQCAYTYLHALKDTGWHEIQEADWERIETGSLSRMARALLQMAEREEREAEARMLKQVGQRYLLWVNQGERQAVVLAMVGLDALVEYRMPRGSSALRIVDVDRPQYGRNVSYHRVPLALLRAMVEEGREWIGEPQKGNPVGSAQETYSARTRKARQRGAGGQALPGSGGAMHPGERTR